jgi:hypothetical protein
MMEGIEPSLDPQIACARGWVYASKHLPLDLLPALRSLSH